MFSTTRSLFALLACSLAVVGSSAAVTTGKAITTGITSSSPYTTSIAAYPSPCVAQPNAQCGGIGWTGCEYCISGFICFEVSKFYYQCIDQSVTGAPSS